MGDAWASVNGDRKKYFAVVHFLFGQPVNRRKLRVGLIRLIDDPKRKSLNRDGFIGIERVGVERLLGLPVRFGCFLKEILDVLQRRLLSATQQDKDKKRQKEAPRENVCAHNRRPPYSICVRAQR